MRNLMALACMFALAGCLGDAAPNNPDLRMTPDLQRPPGSPGDPCVSVCNCGFGLGCVMGKCAPAPQLVYCCDRPMCPPGAACEMLNGARTTCAGSLPMPDLAMMPPPPMPDLRMPPPPDMGMPPPGDGGMMMGPKSCTSNADCPVNVCPPGSKGCTCATTPMGMICVPTCTVAADCPVVPNAPMMQCRMGVCGP